MSNSLYKEMTGIVITMYDEADIVARTIRNCPDAEFVVVHSDNGVQSEDLQYVKQNSTYILQSNLGKELTTDEIGSAAICRNYNIGFKMLYYVCKDQCEFVIGMTGDTLITDLNKVVSIADGHLGYVLQAKGQPFYSRHDRPGIDKPSRMQTDEVNDIMPQFFMFDGKFAYKNRLFTEIVNTNRYTSEENLGNEIMRVLNDMSKIRRIHANPNVYDYHEGIEFQLKGLGHTRKK